MGVEVAGTVRALGPRAGGFALGDEVLTHTRRREGCCAWARQVIASSAEVAGKPPGMPWEHAAALRILGLTAYELMYEVLDAQGGQTLLPSSRWSTPNRPCKHCSLALKQPLS